MKPQFESVTFPKGCSVRVYHRRVAEIPFEWHHHPEYELTLTLNSKGWRFIGDHIGKYRSPDLALVPSDMPHTWASTATIQRDEPHTAIVIWFSGHWALQMAQVCPEYSAIRRLLRNASTGLEFPRAIAKRVLGRLDEILSESPQSRLHATLDLLVTLADVNAVNLSKTAMTVPSAEDSEPAQFTRVLQYLHRSFQEPIRIRHALRCGEFVREVVTPPFRKTHRRQRQRISLQASHWARLHALGGNRDAGQHDRVRSWSLQSRQL